MNAAPRRHRRHRGFSLVEATVAIAVVGVLLAAAMAVRSAAAVRKDAAVRRERMHAIAAAILEEVSEQRYAEPGVVNVVLGVDAGESTAGNRAKLDDIDDYNGLVMTPPRDRLGQAFANSDGLTCTVTVRYVAMTDPAGMSVTNTGLSLITVTVRDGDKKQVIHRTLRSRYDSPEAEPDVPTSHVTGVAMTIATGGSTPASHRVDVNLLNRPLAISP